MVLGPEREMSAERCNSSYSGSEWVTYWDKAELVGFSRNAIIIDEG